MYVPISWSYYYSLIVIVKRYIMKKTAIVSCYFQHNYGSMLQAYATQMLLDRMHIENETIDISAFRRDIRTAKIKYFAKASLTSDILRTKGGMAASRLHKKIINDDYSRGVSLRDSCFDTFSQRFFRMSPKYVSIKELGKASSSRYENILLGSDQLWLPSNIAADYYTLNFVPSSVNTVTYATSFGQSELPPDSAEKARLFLKKIRHISVREASGQKLVWKISGRNVPVVLDPTLLFTGDDWLHLQPEKPPVSGHYILCYFLGTHTAPRKFAERLRKETGYRIVVLPHVDEYVPYDDIYSDIKIYNADPGDFLSLIRNADFVCTDSFHCTAFSILYHRKFFVFRRFAEKSAQSTNSRLDTLLESTGLQSRMLRDDESVSDVLQQAIPYGDMEEALAREREESLRYLQNSLLHSKEPPHKTNISLHVAEKGNCCGCSTCTAVCPQDCIRMVSDKEGFRYPSVDDVKCISCGACLHVCPTMHPKAEKPFEQEGFIAQHRDQRVLRQSTSGGAFTAIAQYVLKHHGAVFGAAMDPHDMCVCHICVEKEKDLYRFRNSKYVQSYISKDLLRKMQDYLREGRLVCFSGTPCQVEGVRNLAGRYINNLILIDVVCRAVPSPLAFQRYLEYQKKNIGEAARQVRFRDKYFGYKYSTLNICTAHNHGSYHEGVESDPWLRAYFSNICNRPSCYECRFRKQYRVSDLTLWDCFQVGRFSKDMDNDRGATRILVHSARGREIIRAVHPDLQMLAVEPKEMLAGTKEMFSSVPVNPKRDAFLQDASDMDGTELFSSYFPFDNRVKLKRSIRRFFLRTGLYSEGKKMFVKITHKY